MAESVLEALREELAAYQSRGEKDRAAQVQEQIDLLTGAAAQRAEAPAEKRTPRGRQTRKG